MSQPTESQHPYYSDFQKSQFELIRVANQVPPAIIQDALLNSHHTLRLDELTLASTSDIINMETVGSLQPSWLNTIGLLTQMRALNHPEIWKRIFEYTGHLGDGLFRNPSDKHFSERISQSNGIFFESTNILLGLAGVFGQNFPSLLIPQDLIWKGGVNASLAVSSRFPETASTPKEATDRITSIFAPPQRAQFAPAYEALTGTHAFRLGLEENDVSCPAPTLTIKVYHAFGDLLQTNPDYRNRFQAGITLS